LTMWSSGDAPVPGPWTLKVLYNQEAGLEGDYEVIIVPA